MRSLPPPFNRNLEARFRPTVAVLDTIANTLVRSRLD